MSQAMVRGFDLCQLFQQNLGDTLNLLVVFKEVTSV